MECTTARIAIERRPIVAKHLLVGCEIERSQWVARQQKVRPLQVRQSFPGPALGNQRHGKILFGGEVVPGHLQSVAPEA